MLGVNTSPDSVAHMRQWIGSALVQLMACRLFGAKPLPKPTLDYYQMDPQEQRCLYIFLLHVTPAHNIQHTFPCGNILFCSISLETRIGWCFDINNLWWQNHQMERVYQFPNFNGRTVEVWECINYFITWGCFRPLTRVYFYIRDKIFYTILLIGQLWTTGYDSSVPR